jgi:hypothetical protein
MCLTEAVDILSTSVLKLTLDSSVLDLLTETALASYEQSEIMTVSTVEYDADILTFTGTGFPTSGYTAYAAFDGVNATTVTVDSETSVTAEFTVIGLAATTGIPELYFQSTTDTFNYIWAHNNVSISKPLNVTSSSSQLSCSFAGGCQYEIEADGLFALLQNELNYV